MMGVIIVSSGGAGHRDDPLFDDDAAVAVFDDAGFMDIWECTIF
jgi:hypothetical protein